MTIRRIVHSSVFLWCAAFAAAPASAAEPVAVLELFTSQGCSSCPAADRLLGEIARDPSVIALTLAVDYWDYLGWKDTLALHGHSSRQRAYSQVRGDRTVYTPQIIVNGTTYALGSDRAAIDRALAQSRLSLPVKLTVADGKVTVNVPAAKNGRDQGEVWLCPVTSRVPVTIDRGENKGRELVYSNVVRRWIKLGDWSGKAETFSTPLANAVADGVDHMAVVVQGGVAAAPGTMLGAAMTPLR